MPLSSAATAADTYILPRYYTDLDWPDDERSIKILERDSAMTSHRMPRWEDTSERCINVRQGQASYLLRVCDDESVSSGSRTVTIAPGQFLRLPVRVMRFAFRDPLSVAAVLSSAGSKLDNSIFGSHDGLVVLPNHNFVGPYCSEISHVGVYNAGSRTVTCRHNCQKTLRFSPLSVTFEHVRSQFEEAHYTGREQELIIPARGYIEVPFNIMHSGMAIDPSSDIYIFLNSIGSCNVPEGVFFQNLIPKSNKLEIYNVAEEERKIVLREDLGDGSTSENFLGYVYRVTPTFLATWKGSVDTNYTINLDEVKLHSIYVLNPKRRYTIPPGRSMNVMVNSVKVVRLLRDNQLPFGLTKNGEVDKSYRIKRYLKLISSERKLVCVTPFVNEESAVSGHSPLSLALLNTYRHPIEIDPSKAVAACVVCEAAMP
uniref:Wsv526-like protein n=1 Tax=Sicyonia whispovirus TaxID=2984283 RepID=A0A9C7BNR5_9VIRU|nr:MAG: wsv526-like protein [Sicyonia whispovirus]